MYSINRRPCRFFYDSFFRLIFLIGRDVSSAVRPSTPFDKKAIIIKSL
ncbi:hypothetical protein GCWU000246_00306 [Jonquetella anthropi E3_33 E1]|nr:hypothetical protein GCWU000246_00306 [Jonquetella anthropi E3_33 E1]